MAHPAKAPTPWLTRARSVVVQEPLFDTPTSLAAIERADPQRPPRTLYFGIGLCGPDQLSKAVPLDLLGLLLPAEELRRALGASRLVALIADRHALENGFVPAAVERRARAVETALAQVKARCRLDALLPVRASSFHDSGTYRGAFETVRRRSGGRHHAYVARQLADAIYLERECGPLLKVGWAARGPDPLRQRDEQAFDAALRDVFDDRVSFVYAKPGRTLTDESPRMPPYVVKRPDARLCLERSENAVRKLDIARRRASPHTVAGCLRHWRRMVYTFGRLIEPLPHGPIETRVNALIRKITPPPAAERAPHLLRAEDGDSV